MKTGTILFFGGAVLLVLGILGGLVFIQPLLHGEGSAFSNLMAVLVFGALPIAAGIVLIGAGNRRGRFEKENEERVFGDAALALARKNGGQVTADQVAKATGLTRDDVSSRMRALAGRGVFDLDFDPGGQMVWKLSPNAGRAQLSELAGRGR